MREVWISFPGQAVRGGRRQQPAAEVARAARGFPGRGGGVEERSASGLRRHEAVCFVALVRWPASNAASGIECSAKHRIRLRGARSLWGDQAHTTSATGCKGRSTGMAGGNPARFGVRARFFHGVRRRGRRAAGVDCRVFRRIWRLWLRHWGMLCETKPISCYPALFQRFG